MRPEQSSRARSGGDGHAIDSRDSALRSAPLPPKPPDALLSALLPLGSFGGKSKYRLAPDGSIGLVVGRYLFERADGKHVDPGPMALLLVTDDLPAVVFNVVLDVNGDEEA